MSRFWLFFSILFLLGGCQRSPVDLGIAGSGILYQLNDGENIKTVFNGENNVTSLVNFKGIPDNSEISEPVWSQKLQQYFVSIVENNNSEIYTFDVNFNNPKNITNTRNFYETNPLPSPNGKFIAFERYDSKPDIWIMDNSGKDLKNLTGEFPGSSTPVWDEDGTHIFFSSLKNGTPNIFRINIETGELTNLSNGNGLDGAFSLSFDRKILTFDSDRNGLMDIFVLYLETGELKNITNSNYREVDPIVSPDGKKVIYRSDINGEWNLWITDIESGTSKMLTNNAEKVKGNVIWHENSNIIYFNMAVGVCLDIFSIDVNTGVLKNLTNTPSLNEYAPKYLHIVKR